MAMQLGQGDTGHLVIISDQPFPACVKHVEYYRDQKLFNLVFMEQEHPGDLTSLELPDDIDTLVKNAPSSIIVMDVADTDNLQNYQVPLVQVGI